MSRKSKTADRKGSGARAAERQIAHAVIHPVRLDALSILFERVTSPKEIAGELGVPLGTVSFHVGELLADDAIELVRTEPRRGAVEHYYRARMRPEVSNEKWLSMPRQARRRIAALALQAIVAEGLSSLRHGKMEDEDLHLSWIPVRLDSQGREEVAELQAEMLERLEDICERNDSRAPEDGEPPPMRVLVMMGFERGRPDDGRAEALDIDSIAG